MSDPMATFGFDVDMTSMATIHNCLCGDSSQYYLQLDEYEDWLAMDHSASSKPVVDTTTPTWSPGNASIGSTSDGSASGQSVHNDGNPFTDMNDWLPFDWEECSKQSPKPTISAHASRNELIAPCHPASIMSPGTTLNISIENPSIAPSCTRQMSPPLDRRERRREQNRAAQKRFRASKESKLAEARERIRMLEDDLQYQIERNYVLQQEWSKMKEESARFWGQPT